MFFPFNAWNHPRFSRGFLSNQQKKSLQNVDQKTWFHVLRTNLGTVRPTIWTLRFLESKPSKRPVWIISNCFSILLMVQKSSVHQLMQKISDYLRRVLHLPGGWVVWEFWTFNRVWKVSCNRMRVDFPNIHTVEKWWLAGFLNHQQFLQALRWMSPLHIRNKQAIFFQPQIKVMSKTPQKKQHSSQILYF